MIISSFHVAICYAVDLGAIMSPQSRALLQSLRASSDLFAKFKAGVQRIARPAGSFHPIGDQGQAISREVRRSLVLGGKNIFSPLFFARHAPFWLTDDRNEHLSDLLKRSSEQALTASDLEIDLTDQSIPMCVYRGAELRLFRGGTLSMRFSFSNPRLDPQASFGVDDFIRLIRNLETQSYVGFQKRIVQISTEWSDPGHPVAESTGLRFEKCDLEASNVHGSQVRSYRTVLMDTPYQRDPATRQRMKQSVPGLDARQLLGILNLAPWYNQYNPNYVSRTLDRGLSYKDNELFLCDGNASLIVLPEYWTTPRLKSYVNHLSLLGELLNAQLCYLEALADSLEGDLMSAMKRGFAQQAVTEAALMKGLILQVEDSGDVNSLVRHGFSRKYLERVRDELKIPDHTAALYRRMSIVDARLTQEAEQRIASHGLSLENRAVRIALLALALTVLLQLCQLLTAIVIAAMQLSR